MKNFKYYIKTLNTLVFLLNMIFIIIVLFLYYDDITIFYNFENILYGTVIGILFSHLLYFLYLINECKNFKIINIFFTLLKALALTIFFYILAFNIKGLNIAILHVFFHHDLVYENIFGYALYNYTKEELIKEIVTVYPEISKINSFLDEKTIHHILGNAKTMFEVRRNVELYCQIEPTGMYQRILNYYRANQDIVFLGCAVLSIGLIVFVGGSSNISDAVTLIRDTKLIKSSLKELTSIASNLISTEIAIKESNVPINHDLIIAHLTSILEKLNELNNKL